MWTKAISAVSHALAPGQVLAPGALALLILALAGCGSEPRVEVPLLDGIHEPEVLTETAQLQRPPSDASNRFVRGWHPWARPEGEVLVPGVEEAVLEITNLKQRRRELRLRFDVFEPTTQERLVVCANGTPIGSAPLANPLAVPLPAELPIGRVAITLNCGGNPEPPTDAGAPLGVTGAVVRPALTAGEVSFLPAGIVQAPWSSIDFVRLLDGPTTLVGRFNAPVESGEGLRFSISLEAEGGAGNTVWEWPGSGADFEIDLPAESGLIRIRLAAEGEGAPGRWEGLRLLTRAIGRPQPVPPPAPKIVVFYILDALRADALGFAGGVEGVTPTIDRLASEGVVLTNHFSVAPNTMPSTKALFTGRGFRTKGGWKLPPDAGSTLAEAFLDAGYRTGAFSANAFVGREFGLARGFEHAPRGVGEVNVKSGQVANAQRVHSFGLRWLEAVEPAENAFFYLHTVHPHNPYDPPEPFRSRFTEGINSEIDGSSRTILDIKHLRIEASEADRERLKGLYRGGLAYNDAELAKLLEILEARYAPGEMLFVLTSDHGEELFDHGGVLHGYTLYDEQVHIPMIFWWPGVLEPAEIDLPTDQLDLHATLRSLVAPEGADLGEGEVLWDLLRGETGTWSKPVRFAAASSVKGGIFMARSDDAKLIWAPRSGSAWGMGQGLGRSSDPEYFFDLSSDPDELQNLAGGPSLEAVWLRALMRGWIEREKALDLENASPDEIDDETRQRLRALGYLD